MAIGYRMLGSVQEAEDLVQDAWLRWHDEVEGSRVAVLVPEAWLVTVTGGTRGFPAQRGLRSRLQAERRRHRRHYLRHADGMRLELALLNREWALLRYLQGELESVQAFEFVGGRISQVRIQRNPAKLAEIRRHSLLRAERP